MVKFNKLTVNFPYPRGSQRSGDPNVQFYKSSDNLHNIKNVLEVVSASECVTYESVTVMPHRVVFSSGDKQESTLLV